MDDISVSEALQLASEREESVRSANMSLDKEFGEIREAYCLSEDADQWSSLFAARIISNNKEYRLRVKQDMQTAAHNLKHLYSEGGDGDDSKTSNAMQILVAVVVSALKANRRVNRLLDEYDALQKRLTQAGLLTFPDKVFIRKTLPDLERCRKQLGLDAEQIKSTFDKYKQTFYVLSYERELRRCQAALSARKSIKRNIEQETAPIFKILSTLLKERRDIHQEATHLGFKHTTEWFSLLSERVPMCDFHRVLAQFDVLRERVWAQRSCHEASVEVLRDIECSGEFSPRTLPGADGKEIPADNMRTVFTAYESIHASCSEVALLAEPIIETIEKYLLVLRETELLARAFAVQPVPL